MRLSESLRNEADHKVLVGDRFCETRLMLTQAADLLDVYYIQCKAASVAETRREARKNIRSALEGDTT